MPAAPLVQNGVVPEQSPLLVHWTHCAVARSQRGAPDAHWASTVHPWRHLNVRGSQTGAAVPQSTLDKHSTQAPLETSHRGCAAGQSSLVAHWTHRCVVESQTFAAAGQSAAVLQPTQAPVIVSQMDALRPVHDWLLEQAA
jgi:hypothetical protein